MKISRSARPAFPEPQRIGRRTAWQALHRLAALGLVALVLSACGGGVGNDGATVGGSCESDGDCVARCEKDGDFPGGVCTESCESSADCPAGSVCIEKEGGLCLLECASNDECRPGWDCDSEDLEGSEQKANVCIAD